MSRTKIEVPCSVCGKPIVRVPCKIHKDAPNYCGVGCRNHALAIPAETRFWSHVDKSGECWNWTAAKDKNGYGWFTPVANHIVLAHRFAWELEHGPIPSGAHICHHCDNPSCVRPDHLFLGNNRINVDDKLVKCRQPRGETHGNHKLTESDVREIRKLYDAGVHHYVISEQFNTSYQNVDSIGQRKAWRHID